MSDIRELKRNVTAEVTAFEGKITSKFKDLENTVTSEVKEIESEARGFWSSLIHMVQGHKIRSIVDLFAIVVLLTLNIAFLTGKLGESLIGDALIIGIVDIWAIWMWVRQSWGTSAAA